MNDLRPHRLRARFRWLALAVLLAGWTPAWGATRTKKPGTGEDPAATLAATPATASSRFAPLPPEHPLADLWNDPEFTRRLVGSYGFHPQLEPRLTPEEQARYRDRILPLLREDPKRAIPELEAAINPQASATFDYTLATIYFQEENFAAAITHYEAALAKFPDFLRAQRNLGLALVRDGQYADAIRPLTRTLALGGADGKIYGLLAFAHVSLNQFVAATAAYQQALLFEPDNLDYQLGLVKCQVATAHYDAALALLSELLERHPDRDALWSLQANLYIQKNDLPRATVTYEMLRRLGRATPTHLSLLGDLYVSQDVPELALSAYLAATDAEGGTNVTRALRAADVFVSRGSWDEARRLFAAIRERLSAGGDPADQRKLLRLEARVALATGDSEGAIQRLEQLLAQNPLDGEALLLAGDHYRQAGDPERAVFRYDAAAKLEGFAAQALVKHAQLLVEGRRYPQALELLRQAQKLEPRDHVQRYLEKVEAVASRAGG